MLHFLQSIISGPVTIAPGTNYADITLMFVNIQRQLGMNVVVLVNLQHVDAVSGVGVSTMSTTVILQAPGNEVFNSILE